MMTMLFSPLAFFDSNCVEVVRAMSHMFIRVSLNVCYWQLPAHHLLYHTWVHMDLVWLFCLWSNTRDPMKFSLLMMDLHSWSCCHGWCVGRSFSCFFLQWFFILWNFDGCCCCFSLSTPWVHCRTTFLKFQLLLKGLLCCWWLLWFGCQFCCYSFIIILLMLMWKIMTFYGVQ